MFRSVLRSHRLVLVLSLTVVFITSMTELELLPTSQLFLTPGLTSTRTVVLLSGLQITALLKLYPVSPTTVTFLTAPLEVVESDLLQVTLPGVLTLLYLLVSTKMKLPSTDLLMV